MSDCGFFRDELTYEEKLEMKMGESLVGGKIQEASRMAYELENKIKNAERTCEFYEGQTLKVSVELGASRMENESLKKRSEALELENSELKKLLLLASREKNEDVNASYAGNINSGNGSEETEMEYQGGKGALEIFPEEVWRTIFHNMKEPKDLKSCYETCATFQSLLEDKRQLFLFSDVLSILNAYLPEMELPSILNSCRLVCHDWKQCVDSYLQSEILSFSPSDIQNRPRYWDHPALRFTLYKNPWNKTLKAIDDEINPIPSRYLVYDESGTYSVVPGVSGPPLKLFTAERLSTDLISFLAMFGSHIWAFKFQLTWEYSESYAKFCYSFLRLAMSMMRNLKMLHISRPCYFDPYERRSLEEQRGFTSGKSQYLDGVARENPFPNLCHLKTVYLTRTVTDSCPDPLIHAVLAANPQVEKMELNTCFGKTADIFDLELPKLQELSIITRNNHKIPETMTWKVEKLSVDSESKLWTDCESFFRNLEKSFGGTVRELKLRMCGLPVTHQDRLNLPKLKVLEVYPGVNKIDFILPMINLEYLSVEGYLTRSFDGASGVIQLLEHFHDLKKSNVWQLFPKLKMVRVRNSNVSWNNPEWKCCTRAEAGIY